MRLEFKVKSIEIYAFYHITVYRPYRRNTFNVDGRYNFKIM